VKIKLDENPPERLVATLVALGHDIDTVRADRHKPDPAGPRFQTSTSAALRDKKSCSA